MPADMCSQYPLKAPLHLIEGLFRQIRIPLVFPEGRPNLEPREQITIGDPAPVVTGGSDEAALRSMPFGWKGPGGRPVFNFRSEGRRFASSQRCLVPASGFYEFTDPEPGQKRKTKWLFTLQGCEWFWIAGVVREGGFAMLTTAPGEDVAPYHDRQIVLLAPETGPEWLNLSRPEADLLTAPPAGSLTVERVFPPVDPTLL